MFDNKSSLGTDPFDDPDVIASITEAERKATMPDKEWERSWDEIDFTEKEVDSVYSPEELAARRKARTKQMSATGKIKPMSGTTKFVLLALAGGAAYYYFVHQKKAKS